MSKFICVLIFIIGIIISYQIALKNKEPFERFDIACSCYALGALAMAITMLII